MLAISLVLLAVWAALGLGFTVGAQLGYRRGRRFASDLLIRLATDPLAAEQARRLDD